MKNVLPPPCGFLQGWSEFDNFVVRAQRRPCEQSSRVKFFCEQQKNGTECKDCELQIIQDSDENLGACENCRLGILAQQNAFTLAEVLIALVVIGIVAAITLTTVMPNIQERANSQRQANMSIK